MDSKTKVELERLTMDIERKIDTLTDIIGIIEIGTDPANNHYGIGNAYIEIEILEEVKTVLQNATRTMQMVADNA